MADFTQHNQFVSNPGSESQDPRGCARFESLLADAVDGTLSPGEQAEFQVHRATCDPCAAIFADAERGARLLGTLRLHRPAPALHLLNRILAQTSHAAEAQPAPAIDSSVELGLSTARGSASLVRTETDGAGVPLQQTMAPARVLPFRRFVERLQPLRQTLLQPRLAMTAAMAFFSVALTLNLTGVHVTALRPSDLRPSSLKRSFYEADAHVFRYYDNLRVVYELESRVHDLQRSAAVDSPESPVTEPNSTPSPTDPVESTPAQPGSAAPGKTPGASPRPRPGTSLREPLIPDRRLNAELLPFQSPPAIAASVVPFAHRRMQGRDLA